MNSRLGIACLSACAITSLIIAGAGCTKGYNAGVAPPAPSPSPSGSPAPDTIYVQTENVKVIRQYKGASKINGGAVASEVLSTGDNSNGDVVYDPVSDTLWYPEANTPTTKLLMWIAASTKNGKNPDFVIPFPFGEGAAAFDQPHHLLYVATYSGPQVSVFANAETMTSSATPAAVITMQITDPSAPSPAPRPQEMFYDPTTDRLFASDNGSMVAVFDNFGSAAANAVLTQTNPTIPANRVLSALFSPDGLAYAPPPSDELFIGEQRSPGDIVVVHTASSFNGDVSHSQMVTGFSKPGGMAYDNVRNLLFVYDSSPIYDISNALTMAGSLNSLIAQGTVKSIFDATGQSNVGFGFALDTTH